MNIQYPQATLLEQETARLLACAQPNSRESRPSKQLKLGPTEYSILRSSRNLIKLLMLPRYVYGSIICAMVNNPLFGVGRDGSRPQKELMARTGICNKRDSVRQVATKMPMRVWQLMLTEARINRTIGK